MLSSIFGKSLRDSRRAVPAWGLSLGLLGLFLISAFSSLTPEAIDAATRMLTQLPPGLRGVLGDIEITPTISGLLNWRYFFFFPFLIAIFTIQQGAAALGGEEQKKTIDIILSCPVPRWRVALEKFAALTVNTLIVGLLITLSFWLAIAVFSADVEYQRVPLAVLNGLVVGLVFGAFAFLLTGLLPGRRTAGLITALLLVASYFLHTLASVAPGLSPYRPLSVFYHYTRSQPMTSGTAWESVALLAGVAALFVIGGVVSFQLRDVGAGPAITGLRKRRDTQAGEQDRRLAPPAISLLSSIFGQSLRDARWPVIAWGGSLALMAIVILAFYPLIQQATDFDRLIASLPPALQAMVGDLAESVTLAGFLNASFLTYLPVVLSVFAISQSTDSIAAEEERQYADVVLSLPITRRRLLAEKIASAVVGLLAAAAIIFGGLTAGVALMGGGLEWSRILGAVANAVPPALAMGALALFVSSLTRGHGTAVGVATAVTAVSYFLNTLAPLVTWLEPLQPLSVFYHYSNSEPLTGGPAWPSIGLLLAISLLLYASSVIAFERRDIAT